ncbi:MAG: hypothetical protein R6X06_01560 [Gammaproteobacteria bacterium]
MREQLPPEPAWKTSPRYRLGSAYRVCEDRFIHIKQLGWFVQLRGEFTAVDGISTSDSLAGPFTSRACALAYLRLTIQMQAEPA